jgi:hypothetical protein
VVYVYNPSYSEGKGRSSVGKSKRPYKKILKEIRKPKNEGPGSWLKG